MAVGRRMALLCLCTVLRGLSIKLRGAYCHRGGSQCCWSCSQQRQLPASARIARLLGSELFSSASLDSTRPFQVLSSSGHCVHQSESYSVRGRTGALSPARLLREGVAPRTSTQQACFLLRMCPSRLCWDRSLVILQRRQLLPWSTQPPCRLSRLGPRLVEALWSLQCLTTLPLQWRSQSGRTLGKGARYRPVTACDRREQNPPYAFLVPSASAGFSDV